MMNKKNLAIFLACFSLLFTFIFNPVITVGKFSHSAMQEVTYPKVTIYEDTPYFRNMEVETENLRTIYLYNYQRNELETIVIDKINYTTKRSTTEIYKQLSDEEVGQLMKEVYESFTPEQKSLFISNMEISGDIQMMNYHKQYVDPDYEVMEYDFVAYNVYTDLARLGLPSAVLYALNAFIVALPSFGIPTVGQVIAAAAVVALATVLALNWDRVSPHVKAITDYLVSKTRAAVSTITNIFKEAEAEAIPRVTVSGRTITVGNVNYQCTDKAQDAANEMKRKRIPYYPAMLGFDGNIYVAPIAIDRSIALAIMRLNSKTVGVFALSDSLARGLCSGLGGYLIGPEIHGAGSGYWYHYHSSQVRDAHCWYIW
ncbi:UNVERIFIED_CONTAM: hypothetical protein Cloal_3020 [Acetivibrio alkalicellulosi]